jgi:hypothetical protein
MHQQADGRRLGRWLLEGRRAEPATGRIASFHHSNNPVLMGAPGCWVRFRQLLLVFCFRRRGGGGLVNWERVARRRKQKQKGDVALL